MSESEIPEPWCSLAREWVPRLLAAWSLDGLALPGGNVRLMGSPEKPSVVDGTLYAAVGPLVFTTSHPAAVAFFSGGPVALGSATVSFADPWPRVEPLGEGLRLVWREPGVVHGLFPRAIGVRVVEVRLYARSAVVGLRNFPDKILTW